MIGGAHLKKWQFYDFAFDDLRQPKGTDAIDAHFLTYLQGSNRSLYDELLIYRAGQKPQSLNDFLISLARVMQQYILDGFDIHRAHQDLSEAVLMLDERASVATG